MIAASRLTLALLAVAVAAPAWADGPAPSVRRFAMIVGVSDGGAGRVRLRYATADAQAVARVFEDLGGVARGDRYLLLEPDRTAFQEALGRLRAALQRGGAPGTRYELVFYYSGHSDEYGLLLRGERIAYDELRQALGAMPADVRVAILDSCASGAMTRHKGGTRRPPFLFDDSTRVKGHAYLTSSSADEVAQESDRIGGSYFTHFLITGLRGAADLTRDRRVTLNEVYQFAFNETLARTERTQGGAQHPSYDIQLAGSGDLVLTDLHGTSATMVIAAEVAGRLSIRDRGGHLVAELTKVAGRVVELGLDPGEYQVTLDLPPRVLGGRIRLERGVRAQLVPGLLVAQAVEATARRGEPVAQAQAEAQEPPRRYRRVPFNVSLVPEISLDSSADAINNVSVTLVYGRAARLRGLGISSGVSWIREQADGIEIAAGASLVGGRLHGVQVAGAVNVVRDRVVGLQVAGGFNRGGGWSTVLQISGGMNSIGVESRGLQLSGGLNLAGDFYGLQIAGAFNRAGGRARGLQLSGGANLSGDLAGVQVGGAFNLTAGDFAGLQIGGAANHVKGDFTGLQIGGAYDWVGGELRGLQLAGALNWAGADSRGIQVSGAGNLARGFTGLQVGGAFDWAGGTSRGLQLSGGGNVADDFTGLQVSGGFNHAGVLRGGQLGIINVGGDVHGAQIGVVNVARRVHGTQVGVVNVAEDSDAPIGLVNVIKNGEHHLEVWGSETAPMSVGAKLGSRRVYGVLTAGMNPGTKHVRAAYGGGLGVHALTGRLFLDVDAVVSSICIGEDQTQAGNLNTLRLTLGYRIARRFAVFGGPSLNVFVSENKDSPDVSFGPQKVWHSGDTVVRMWAGFFLGIQI
jgi:hypothetical protein